MRARERIEKETKVKLERDRQREVAKQSGTNHELEDAKDEALRANETRIRERKRAVEKGIRDSIRQQRERFEEEQEIAKNELKANLAEKYERK